MAHITGGGLVENIPRMLPNHLAAEVVVDSWKLQPVFEWLKRAGNVSAAEFARVWNTGIGMVLVVPADKVAEAYQVLENAGEVVHSIGTLTKRSDEACILRNLESWS